MDLSEIESRMFEALKKTIPAKDKIRNVIEAIGDPWKDRDVYMTMPLEKWERLVCGLDELEKLRQEIS